MSPIDSHAVFAFVLLGLAAVGWLAAFLSVVRDEREERRTSAVNNTEGDA